jgi:hypothetical protein
MLPFSFRQPFVLFAGLLVACSADRSPSEGAASASETVTAAPERVWPSDALRLVVESSGANPSFTLSPGVACRDGAEKYTLVLALPEFGVETTTLSWEKCVAAPNSTVRLETGARTIGPAERAAIDDAMKNVAISGGAAAGQGQCASLGQYGYGQTPGIFSHPLRTLLVTSASLGQTTYEDDTFACTGGPPFVHDIDAAFGILRELAGQ